MTTLLNGTERLALLLSLLGEEAQAAARAELQGAALSELEQALADFNEHPPTGEEVDFVLDDFERYVELVLRNVDEPTAKEDEKEEIEEPPPVAEVPPDVAAPQILQLPEEHFEVELEPTRKFGAPTLTGHIEHDLNCLHPYQVATALQEETPEVVSLIVRRLANSHAAKTIEFLPDELREQVVMQMAIPNEACDFAINCLLDKALELASRVEQREVTEESSLKLANLLRALTRDIRAPLLERLKEKDEVLATAVKRQLYRFEDLRSISDRDMQKVLGQLKSEVLVLALQGVAQDLLQKVLSNMSKRAKESLVEEMGFQKNAKPQEVEVAQASVAEILGELDENGDIEVG